jgi:hypothetical protein
MGVIFAYVIVLTLLGKARKGFAFESYGRAGEVDENGNLATKNVLQYGEAGAPVSGDNEALTSNDVIDQESEIGVEDKPEIQATEEVSRS